jgi:hypothetical protein
MPKDLRLKVLEHFKSFDRSTEETIANDWLHKQHSDLGAIRRALEELISTGYLSMSGFSKELAVQWLLTNMDTATIGADETNRADKKSSKRLVQVVGSYQQVPKVRLYTTIDGILFVRRYYREKSDRWFQLLHYL